MKERIFHIIQIGQKGDIASRSFDIGIVVVIFVNIITLFLETFEELAQYHQVFYIIELITMIIFVIEYILRIWTAPLLYPDKTGFKATLKFLVSYDGIIELFTILPFFFMSGFVVFRLLRVVRIFHLFRINLYTDSFHVIRMVLMEKKNQLLSSIFIIVVLMFASSLFMYSVEHDAQPEVFKNAFSGIWWSMSTLLTVGYGDIYPVTIIGRIMAIIIAFLGVGVVAIPTGIISAGFVEQYRKETVGGTAEENGLSTTVVGSESEWVGKDVAFIEANYPINVLLIKRGGKTLRALPESRISSEDELTIFKY